MYSAYTGSVQGSLSPVRVAHLGFPDEVIGLEETILGVTVVLSILGLREHHVSILRDCVTFSDFKTFVKWLSPKHPRTSR